MVTVAAEMQFGGIRADDGNVFVSILGQRQEIVLIFEKDDRFMSGLERERLMFGAVGDFFGEPGINERIVEEVGNKFHAKNTRNGAVDGSLGNFPGVHLCEERGVSIWKRQFDIDAGFEREFCRVFVTTNDVVDAN
jgi:hypothetical protein